MKKSKWRLTQKHIRALAPAVIIISCMFIVFLIGGVKLVMIWIGAQTSLIFIIAACMYIYSKLPE